MMDVIAVGLALTLGGVFGFFAGCWAMINIKLDKKEKSSESP